MISLIVNSKDDARWNRFFGWLRETDALDLVVEIIRIADAKSMCEGYARGTKLSKGDVLVYCHDDVELLSRDLFARVVAQIQHHDVIGVAGATEFNESCNWSLSGRSRGAGQMSTPIEGGYHISSYGALNGATRVQVLDGVFMAARRTVAEKLGWDAETFDGWHFYDIDFSWRAHLAGFRVVVVSDLAMVHHSNGLLDPESPWGKYREKFLAKHASNKPTAKAVRKGVVIAQAADRDEARDAMEGRGPLVNHLRGRRVDIGCGECPADGHEGMDVADLPVVKHVHNINNFPWPFEPGSLAGINCSHVVEHIYELFWHPEPVAPICMPPGADPDEYEWTRHLTAFQVDGRSVCLFMKFFDEVHRVLAPGGTAKIQVPHGRSSRAFQDPTHRRFLQEASFLLYLNKEWRRKSGLMHGAYGVECDFEINYTHLIRDWNFVRSIGPESDEDFQPWIAERLRAFWDVADDLDVTLTKRVPAAASVTETLETVATAVT
jgi:Glycosyltransferase like family